jgi:hypothetical protein
MLTNTPRAEDRSEAEQRRPAEADDPVQRLAVGGLRQLQARPPAARSVHSTSGEFTEPVR